ncbi:MAG: hypothetical protein EA397_09460 [Deltaproteobacteria bacterium]|nr:MAG: hypothetical protein EA397_09460 [Deltaproteobacteria bacterium]
MSAPFTLRFILAGDLPRAEDLAPALEERWTVERREDGVLLIHEQGTLRARLDLLRASSARGRSTLAAVRRRAEAATPAEGVLEALEATRFVLDDATGIVLAQPELDEEGDLDDTLAPLDAVWEHLFEAFGGLLQIDGEGIFGEEGPLLLEA